MRSKAEKILNIVTRPECYEEVIIESASAPIALSIWKSHENDPVIVFIPGIKTHPLFYEDFINLMALNNFNVIGIHLVGHGKSPRVKSLYTYEEMLQNGLDAIEYAVNRFGKGVFLVGSSLGGMLAVDLAGIDNRIQAIFPHNILIPDLAESIKFTRFKNLIKNKYSYKAVVSFVKLSALLFPKVKIPFSFYLEDRQLDENKEIYELFYGDPIGLINYPLYFLASLFRERLSNIDNGRISCPVIALVVEGDPIFPFEYNQKIFQMINAPAKEMLLFKENKHFIFNECAELVAEKLSAKINEIISKNNYG